MAFLMIVIMIAGVAQLYLGYVGIEDWLGNGNRYIFQSFQQVRFC